MTHNQGREIIYLIYYVYEGFISAVSLLNDLTKIHFGFGIFNCIISKDEKPDCYCNKQNNICWFKYELRGFYDFVLRNIDIGQYHIYKIKWIFFSQNEAFLYSKKDC